MFQRDSINPILNNQFAIGDKLTISLVKTADQIGLEKIPANSFHITVFRITPEGDIHCVNETHNNLNTYPKAGDLYDSVKIDIKNINTGNYVTGVYTYFLVASTDGYEYCNEVEQTAVFDRNKVTARGAVPPKQYVQKISFRAVSNHN